MISSIDIAKLRNGEFLQFQTDFLSIVNLNNPATLQVQTHYNVLVANVQEIESLFKTDTANPITEEIAALDGRRDDAINGLLFIVKAYSYHFDAAVQTHAIKLNHHLQLFGVGIAKDNYQSETATIRNIVNDWATQPELTAAITALNLTAWKAELETANNSFADKYLARTQELGAVNPDSIKGKRQETTDAYYALRDRIDAYATINNYAAPYDKTTNEVNALITQYSALLVGRKGSGAAVTPVPPTA